MLSDLWRDCRHALRGLLRQPAFTATIVVALSLGIGANSAIFSAIEAILLREAAVADPGTLVEVYTSSGSNPYSGSSYPDYFDLRDSGAFASLAAQTPVSLTVNLNDHAEPIAGQLVSGNYFEVLGVTIPVGRAFRRDDDRIGAPLRVAIISHALWQRSFGADRTLIGRAITINGYPYTLVGIAPPGFAGPFPGVATDVWVPTALQPEVDPPAAAVRRARGHSATFDLRRSRGLSLTGRLPGSVSLEQAQARADAVSRRLEAAYPDTNHNRRFNVTPLGEGRGLRTATRPILRQLAILVSLVLLVACVNVAGLMLARALSREREVAVRVAIGASRARLVQQWLTESVLLGFLGAAGALVVARLSTPMLYAFLIPEAVDLSVNARVLGFTLAAGIGSGLLFGLAPAAYALRTDSAEAFRASGAAVGGVRAMRLRGAFVILQIAVSLVLLVGAGLFLRTLRHAYTADMSYPLDQIIVASLNLEARGYFEGGARGADAGLAVYEQILEQVEALPGVAAASVARMTVLSGGARSTAVSTDGRPIERDNRNALGVRANVVSRRYFDTMNIPIVRGRSFDAPDGPRTPRVTIVTRSLADRLWPHADPIGRVLRDDTRQVLTVIGVVPDVVYTTTLERSRPPAYYLLLSQNYESGVALHVRATGNALALVPAIREAVRRVDGQLPIEQPRLLRDVLDRTLGRQRMMATCVGLFGSIALMLAALGLYGVMAQSATQRTAEIGIRLALGAQSASILALIVSQGLRLVGTGAALGLVGAFVVARAIESQLFGVTATDPLTFAAGCLMLTVAGLVATTIPALRAMRTDPIAALRRP